MKLHIWSWAFGVICGGIIVFALTVGLMPAKTVIQSVPVPSLQVIRQEVIVEREVQVPSYVVVTFRPEPVTIIKTVPVKPRFFASVEELQDWLDKETFYIPSYPGFDCDDYAKWTQLDAIEAGYQMSTELDYKDGLPHMFNSVIIGNELYFIEAQDHTFWLSTVLD